MDLGKTEALGALAIFLFGSVTGGALMYQQMDDRIESIEEQVQGLQGQESEIKLDHTSQTSLTELFQRADQSVVSISSTGPEPVQGSGFVYSDEGYIVTNHHVIERAEDIRVTFTEEETVDAEVVGHDVYSDLAVLKVDKQGLTPLELADSTEVQVGETAIAIGNPFGLSGTMTAGIVSQKDRLIRTEGDFSIPNVIQTDAAINPGNSGGPLLNDRGEVIGVNTAIETRSGAFSGVGLAVPSNTVERVVSEIIGEGGHEHPWLGVSGTTIDPDIAEEMDLEEEKGFHIVEVVDGGPSDEAGIRAGNETIEIDGRERVIGGDVIVAINGEDMNDISDILLYLERETEVGETVDVTVIRDGERLDVPVTLQSRP